MFLVPNEFSKCTILIECQLPNDNNLDKIGYKVNEEIEIVLGLGATKLSQAIDKKLLTLAEGDKSELNVSEYEIGTEVLVINLVKFTSSKPIHTLEPEEFLNHAKELKSQGTEAFKKKEIDAAFYLFSRSLKYILCLAVELKTTKHLTLNTEQNMNFKNLKCLCHLNLAACQLLGTNLMGAIRNCQEALKIDPSNVKAYFRRGQAHLKIEEYDSSINDFKKVLELEPKNKLATKLLNEAKLHMQKDDKHLGDKLKNMFG